MDSGHQGLFDDEFIVDGLDHRGQAVRGARSARDEVFLSIILLLVDTHDNGQGVILGRGRVDDLLGTAVNDGLGLFFGEENTS